MTLLIPHSKPEIKLRIWHISFIIKKLAHAIFRYFFIYISAVKNENFNGKNDIFNVFAQNIDCGYTLEPPQQGRCNENPQSMI